MTPEQWQKIDEVLQEALDLPPDQRSAYVDRACGSDVELAQEVHSLAAAHTESGDFIETPAIEADADVLFSLGETNIGRVIGPYRIVERLGVGGMGEVYLAKDQRLDRSVALKILPGYLSDEIRLSRFRKEARAASGLNHPNIITIHEVGEDHDVRFIATEFIEGETLRELITRKALTPDGALEVAEQVCAALSAAHAAGIIHRDIKPENIMRRPDGIVKLLDFGIAKLTEVTTHASSTASQTQTEVGLVLGTVNYMSPEQARGLTVDERSDIWSLGVVIYEMLTGRLPFTQATRLDTMVAILERDPRPLFEQTEVNCKQLESLINKCLKKDADTRFQTVSELLSEIRKVRPQIQTLNIESAEEQSINSERSTILLSPPSSRKRSIALVLAIAVVLLVGGTLSAYWWSTRTPKEVVAVPSETKLYADMTEDERLAFIDREEQKVSKLMGEHPVKLSVDALQAIKKRVDNYTARTQNPSPERPPLHVVVERARPYLPTIGRSFRERNVPVIIGVYLPMIESEYRSCHENEVGSKGLFQFMPRTAEQYGLSSNEMCDVEKMAPAAAHFIADRMAELGDDSQSLTLVLLSYNTGAGWVRDTLRNLRASGNYDRNFWTIFANRDSLGTRFQNESAAYIPTFFAAAIIGENPATFGLQNEPLTKLAGETHLMK